MANICNNNFFAYTEDKNNVDVIKNFCKDLESSDIEEKKSGIYVQFESKNVFPEEDMKELYNLLPNKKDIYMRCISVEYEYRYHAFWECDKNGWKQV